MSQLATLIPVIGDVLATISNLIMGNRGSRGPSVDVDAIHRQHAAAIAESQRIFQEQQAQAHAQHIQMIEAIREGNDQERQRMEAAYQAEQARLKREREVEQERYEMRINAMVKSVTDAEQHVKDLQIELRKPILDREAKVGFVNSLGLEIKQNEKLLLVGPKGMGKSTFMWLLNAGEKPVQSLSDGTVEIVQLKKFVDSIGLSGWSTEELLKLLVLMIYDGIPKDLIIFGNDRIDIPLTNLGLLGINNPMIVMMFGDFWQKYEPRKGGRQRIHLLDDSNGVRRVQPVEDLDLVYNLDVYADIKEFGRGTPITHHDNIDALVRDRCEKAKIRPFQHLLEILGKTFTVKATENDHGIEMLFRFIYIYEKKFGRDRLAFMNKATLQDFANLP
ncbi:hypothetical protein BV898_16709 [Hypsibius exemplaris]|uniref:Uncharacterized protein n=1 Tax=Hypsibius exemplaris TaxID=2072580 RepID=A0A9X6RM35_HYPEX|nr:hypothetical protein BV898_16709 [Hypsibius exemplaris]